MIGVIGKDGLARQYCEEPGCTSSSFNFIVGLERAVLECTNCGRRHVLVDKHTRLMAASELVMSGVADSPRVKCPACKGSGFRPDSAEPCPSCYGTGWFDLDRKKKREEKAKKKK